MQNLVEVGDGQTRCIMEDEQMANSVRYFGMLEKVVVIAD